MEVKHDINNQRFFVDLDGEEAYVAYSLRADVMELYSTFTPPKLRGRGLAEKVVRAAFEYAKDNKLKVIPSCSYVAVYLQRHPEYNYLVKLD